MDSSNTLISAKSLAIKYGLVWTAINLVIFLLVYYAGPQLMGTWKYSAIQLVIGLGLAVYFTLEIRKQIGGFWSFSEALKSIFILFIIPTIILFFFSIIFARWIEPTYESKITEMTLNATTELMERITDDQEIIDKAISDAEIAMVKQFHPSFMDIVKSIGFSVIIYFIGAMIWAAIFKKDRPTFYRTEQVDEELND